MVEKTGLSLSSAFDWSTRAIQTGSGPDLLVFVVDYFTKYLENVTHIVWFNKAP